MKLAKLLPLFLILLVSCGDSKVYRLASENPLITTKGSHSIKKIPNGYREEFTSTSAGNLAATALREVHDLDIAFYPRDLLDDTQLGFATAQMNPNDVAPLLSIYPDEGPKNDFWVGVMRGRDIKHFLRTRVMDNQQLDIEVAGMVYNIHMVAGVVTMENYGLDNGRDFDDSQSYRIAISRHFWFGGDTFPGYRFRNGMSFSFVPTGQILSARDTIQQYLSQVTELPYLSETRARFSRVRYDSIGKKKIYEIQGTAHRSPYWGHEVTTEGIVTAVDNYPWHPGGVHIIIQDEFGDGNDLTSDALIIYLREETTKVRVGDKIEITGVVWEQMTLDDHQNMSRTMINETSDDKIKVLSFNNKLPEAVLIGQQGRKIPNKVISSWVGDLNFKPFLNMKDGIDFWESLESMRVKMRNFRIAGFRGGKEELVRNNPQRHLSLYVVPDGFKRTVGRTGQGGLTEDIMAGDFNPEVLHLSAGHLTHDLNRIKGKNPRITYPDVDEETLKKLNPDLSNYRDFDDLRNNRTLSRAIDTCKDRMGASIVEYDSKGEPKKLKCRTPYGILSPDYHYNIGDVLKGEIEGIISFESNLFGGGEFTFVVPEPVFRFDETVPQFKNYPCLVHAYEYMNPSYAGIFSAGIENTSCTQIANVRGQISKGLAEGKFDNEKLQTASASFLRPSFEKDEDGNPKRTVNCLQTDFDRTSMPFECRPVTTLKGEGRHLTIAAYNLENLAGNQQERINQMGMAIRHSLKCPDILSLVEVQDDNGWDFEGGADAQGTLDKIIVGSNCKADGVTYKAININPIVHNEGGQPGGNIRVAYLYNTKRVGFRVWGQNSDGPLSSGALQETRITPEGNLSINPGRVFPNSEAFKNTRKSIVAQFDFMGEKIFVIGNHFNSKLGDTSHWGARQPFYSYSDEERATLAMTINEFVRILDMREPNAHIAVLGDFNAYYNERSMKTLENGGDLTNLMFHGNLVAPNDRYSHNHNGGSSAIDFIFANRNFMKKSPAFEVLHINSDYMGRLSDHDPVVARFYFPYENPAAELEERVSDEVSNQTEKLGLRILDKAKLSNLAEVANNIYSKGSIQNPLLIGTDKFQKLKEKGYCEADSFASINYSDDLNGKILSLKKITDREEAGRRVIDIEFNELPLIIKCLKDSGDKTVVTGKDLNLLLQGMFEASLF